MYLLLLEFRRREGWDVSNSLGSGIWLVCSLGVRDVLYYGAVAADHGVS